MRQYVPDRQQVDAVVHQPSEGRPLLPGRLQGREVSAGLPRELELPADGVLRIRPLRELAKLRYDGQRREDVVVKDGTALAIDEASGDALEFEVTIAAPLPDSVGLTLLGDEQGQGGMSVVAGAGRKTLDVGISTSARIRTSACSPKAATRRCDPSRPGGSEVSTNPTLLTRLCQ